MNPFVPQRLREVTHGGEDQYQFLLVMGHIGGFLADLRHQYDVTGTIEIAQGTDIQAQLVAQDETDGFHIS